MEPTPGNPESTEHESESVHGVRLPLVGPDDIEEQHGNEIDDIVPSYGSHALPVVGLGGSAGSISALGRFFDNASAQGGLAYVVMLHLAPDHQSMLPKLLQRHCAMPVHTAADAAKLEANNVYVIPSGKHLTTVDGHLRLTELRPEHGKRVAVVPNGYLVGREMREILLFATHDLLKDASFSRIDLLSCRNLLIYLDRDAQARCFDIFNFSLNSAGLLFLGSAETIW
ncbi:MAG: hypothetical protein M3N97_11430 [Pseudomonadota bacterium]|nr:hypothetical protein [Pseudomonadota bacterium]